MIVAIAPQVSVAVAVPSQVLIAAVAVAELHTIFSAAGALKVGAVVSFTVSVTVTTPLVQPLLLRART